MITFEEARENLRYDPKTGLLWWKLPRQGRRINRPAGSLVSRTGYKYYAVMLDGRVYVAARLIWLLVTGAWPPFEVDHKDGNPKNNRWGNLRSATRCQNGSNTRLRSNNTSGFKGVSWHTLRNKWRARITVNRQEKHLGLFNTAKQARTTYVKAAKKYFGEFARDC